MYTRLKTYHRVKKGLNLRDVSWQNPYSKQVEYMPLYDGALFTDAEYSHFVKTDRNFSHEYFEIVHIDPKKTYFFFGLRFEQ